MIKKALLTAVLATTVVTTPTPKANTYYPGLLRITEVQDDVVVGVDANGFEWSFSEEGNDYMADDLCSVVYDDKGTEIIFDDEIVAHRYVGTIDMFMDFN